MRLRRAALVIVCAVIAATLPAVPTRAVPPGDFQTTLIVGAGLDGPSGFEIAPDGRIFILERTGTIRIVKDGVLLPEPFADLPSEASGDRGLIGITFDPAFGVTNHYVYFYYTGLDMLNRLVRFDAAEDVGSNGPLTLFQTQSPSQLLHVGGSIAFGPDGKLYLAVGDNGHPPNAQDLSNPHGKILRINRDGSIPPDNPFVGQPGVDQAIWAYGFRNPWRFQFDAATGALYGGDVGDFTWEELNHIVRGGNYGWPVKEGLCASDCAGYIDPIHAYPHNGESAAVTGGPVYRGAMFPAEYQGNLFFGDYAQGFLRRAVLDGAGNVTAVHDFDPSAGSVVDIKVASDGSLYYLTYYPGALYRVTYNTTSHLPVVDATADVTKGLSPLTVHFSSGASYDPDGDPLTYHWAFGNGTTSTLPNPTVTYTGVGVYTATLTVSDGQDQVTSRPIVVQVGVPPTLIVATPVDGALYRSGDTITYNAFASDAAGFDLNDAGIATSVLLHHHTHTHPFAGPLIGRAGSFTIPVSGEASADTWFEIIVTATDSNGLSATKSVSIYPVTTQISLASNLPGAVVLLDGVPTTTPATFAAVVGFQREIAAPPTVVAADGTNYYFTGWSDGGAIRHTISAPEQATTYTATYAPSAPWAGEYFANRNLTGNPVLTRSDATIDFLWNLGAPAPAVPAENFSVRWTKTQYFAAGSYRFTTVSDDGVRLRIDGQVVIDRWQDQSATVHMGVIALEAGQHTVVLEYFDSGWDAMVKLTWDTTTEVPPTAWRAEYWNTPGATSAPAMPMTAPTVSRQESEIDHVWWRNAPAPGVAVDHFVARWTRVVDLAAGTYEFAVTADDGVRLLVDGAPVVDRWVDQSATTHIATVALAAGPHTLVMEYYENAWDATAKLTWQATAAAPTTWRAEYWNTPGAGSAPVMPTRAPDLTRDEGEINHQWWLTAPAPGISADHFVARWTRVLTLPTGTHEFIVTADDGVRLYVDGVLVLDRWVDQSASTWTVPVALAAGAHTVVLEYYENGWDATAKLDVRHGT